MTHIQVRFEKPLTEEQFKTIKAQNLKPTVENERFIGAVLPETTDGAGDGVVSASLTTSALLKLAGKIRFSATDIEGDAFNERTLNGVTVSIQKGLTFHEGGESSQKGKKWYVIQKSRIQAVKEKTFRPRKKPADSKK